MVATAPVSYQIPITQELLYSIMSAQYAAQVTVVQRFIPPIAVPEAYRQEGMVPLENQQVVFRCFEALKQCLVCFAASPSPNFNKGAT
jgi:hypothetical protein